jgi:TP901 family phage tail tape measure protein
MTNSNPIKYSDLISSDDSIKELIAQLTSLIAKYEELKTKISGSAGELSKSLKDISGATEAQREAIASLTTESEKLAKEYQNIDNLQKAATKETKKLTDAEKEKIKIDKLAKQAADAKDGSFNKLSAIYRLNKIRLNEMSEAERHGTEAGRQLEKETKAIYEQMSNLQKATGKYTLEVGHYENALTRLPGPMGVIVDQFTKLRTTISGISSSSLPGGQKALLAFGAIAGGVAATVIGLAKSIATVIRTNAEFEQAVTNLSTIIGKSRKEMEALTDSALLLGRTTEYTASQVVQLQTNLAKLGFKDEAIIGMQRSVLQFATAVGANLEEAAYVAGATLRSFNLTSADTEDTLATLAVATNNSALSFYRIRESMGTVFPVANAFGLNVKDTAALLGTLADAGFDASMSATAVRNILIHLIKTDGDLAKSLNKPVKSFDDIIAGMKELRQQGINLGEVLELTDRRTVGPLNALMAGAERAEKLRASLEDVDGELERIQKERLNTVQGSTLLLKSAWEGLELAFRESNGTVKDTIDWLTKLTQAVQKLLFPEQTAAQSFGDIYTEEFNKLIKDGVSYENLTYRIQKRQQEFAEGVKREYKSLQDASPFTAQKRRKEYDELLAMQQGYNKAAENAQNLWKNNEAERAQQEALRNEERKRLLQELSAEDKKRIDEANKARIRELQAIVDSINFEIAATTAGTEAMLDARLRKVEAERNLELERNRQKVETERKDEAIINAKFDADRIKAQIQFNKEVSQLNVQRLQAEQQAIQLQLSNVKKGTERELSLRLQANEKAMEIEIEQNKVKDERIRQSEDAIRAKYNNQALQLQSDFLVKMAQRDLKATQDLAASEFALLDRNERQKTQFRLEQEKARLEEVLRINELATDKMTEAEVKAIRAAIVAIDNEKKRLGFDNIYELLGIGLDSKQQEALNTALDSIKDSIGSLIDSWSQAADAARSAADAQVEAAKKALDAEIEARRQGYASKEEEARKELALAKSTQAAAIEEQRKAQRAQETIDTLTQASSLTTATANIWKALSGIEGIGPVLAIAAIASMWTSFGAAKIRAAQLTRSEQYGEGTVELLQGGSHASGHDIDLGTKRDGTKRRAEGGEYFAVINKRNSRKYGSLIPEVINSLNNGTFSERFARAGDQMAGAVLALGSTSADVSRLERDVKAIREQGAERRFTDGHGNTIIQYKNLTRKIKS